MEPLSLPKLTNTNHMKKIYLTDEVMVSDPCYTVPTWCQQKVNNVLPGYYQPFCKLHDAGDWGVRNSMLLVIHEDYQFEFQEWEHMESADIGVDSGQAGFFSMRTYRNDEHSVSQDRPAPSGKPGCSWEYNLESMIREEGDKFYDLMCGLTLNTEEMWGVYDEGVVSRSGFGDGSYNLYVAKNGDGQIIGLCIDFNVEEEEVINFDFYIDSLNN